MKKNDWYKYFGVFNEFDFMIHYANDDEYKIYNDLHISGESTHDIVLKTLNRIRDGVTIGDPDIVSLVNANLDGRSIHICFNP